MLESQKSDAMHIDPVCGMKVSAEKAAGSTVRGNTRYFFCSEGCLRKFEADPEKYLSSAPKREQMSGAPGLVRVVRAAPKASCETAERKIIYTCPMHPEVRQSSSGAGAICGIALETEISSDSSATAD